MRQVSVPIDDAVYERAKDAARKAGMLFRFWVERAIAEKAERERPAIKLREPAR